MTVGWCAAFARGCAEGRVRWRVGVRWYGEGARWVCVLAVHSTCSIGNEDVCLLAIQPLGMTRMKRVEVEKRRIGGKANQKAGNLKDDEIEGPGDDGGRVKSVEAFEKRDIEGMEDVSGRFDNDLSAFYFVCVGG